MPRVAGLGKMFFLLVTVFVVDNYSRQGYSRIMTTTNTTIRTETGIDVRSGQFSVRIDQNDHEGHDFIATFGRYDSQGTFCCSACFPSRSYKTMERALSSAEKWLTMALAAQAAPRGTLLADDRITEVGQA
jgi:hypothetical protein